MSAGYYDIALCAPFSLVPERFSTKSTQRLIAEVLSGVMKKARMPMGELDGLSIASFTLAPDTAIAMVEHLGLSCRYVDQPILGGASAIAAVRRAARMVAAGDVRTVAIIGADKNDATSFSKIVEDFSVFARDAVWPYGAGGPNAVFALITDHYMHRFGAAREDFGALCVAQRNNAQGVPHAIFRDRPLDLSAYMSARPIAEPLCLYDCVMPVAGGEGCLVMHMRDAEAAGLPYARRLATLERHNAFCDDPVQTRGGWAMDEAAFWAQSGTTPDTVDCIETYDDYPVMSFIQLEDLGFCSEGEAAAFVRTLTRDRDGRLPINTSGGQLSAGQAGAAGGHLGLVEGLRQVTGLAEGWAVERARTALVAGYGMANFDRGLCATAALLAEGRRA
ncbi:MAG: thiolase family protein [Pseudomonadota bacterium]